MSKLDCDQPRHADLAPRLHLEVHMQMGPTGATEVARLIAAYRAEVLREAAGMLRRTPRGSRDYPAALTGARLIETELSGPDKT